MPVAPETALEAALALARTLNACRIPYALGGALAYGQYAIPRATNDVDINVFLAPEDLGPLFEALVGLGISVDPQSATKSAQDEGSFIVYLGGFRIDVFTPSIDFSWEAQQTRIKMSLGVDDVWFLSVEALCVFKLLFYRAKDFADLERLLAMRLTAVDVAYVRRHLVAMMGDDDERVATWDELTAPH